MQKQTDIERAVARIYCAMLDNIALDQKRLYVHDVMTYGTGAMKFNAIDGKARHCAIHGCSHCKRRIELPTQWAHRDLKRAGLVVLASLFALACLVFRIWWDGR